MGFEFNDSALLHLEICGKKYVCATDSPDFFGMVQEKQITPGIIRVQLRG